MPTSPADSELLIFDSYGTTQDEISQKEKSILVGVSLGNRFFDKVNLENYIRWALENTRERVAVFIPDELEAINIHYKDGKSLNRSMQLAKKKGKRIKEQVEHVRESVNVEQGGMIDILDWSNVKETIKYTVNSKRIAEIFREEKGRENGFSTHVFNFVDNFLNKAGKTLSENRKEGLCKYFLEEFSVLVGGLEYCLPQRTQIYELLPYPILDDVQRLIIDIQNGTQFPIFRESLIMNGKLSTIALNYSHS